MPENPLGALDQRREDLRPCRLVTVVVISLVQDAVVADGVVLPTRTV